MSRQIETGYSIPGKVADVVVFDSEFKIKAIMVKALVSGRTTGHQWVKGSIKKLEL